MAKPDRVLEQRKCEIRDISEDGTIIGYGSVFNVIDSQGSRIAPGAFTRTLNNRKSPVRLLTQHEWNSNPIGVFTSLEEDTYGLKFTAQLALDTQAGRETYALLKMGAMDGMSIGFFVLNDSWDQDTGVRTITEVKLMEISVVTFPANEDATVTQVKSMRDAFESLNEEQRIQVHALINSFTKSLPSGDPQVTSVATDPDKHSDTEEPDTKPEEDSELLHSLEQLTKALQRATTAISLHN